MRHLLKMEIGKKDNKTINKEISAKICNIWLGGSSVLKQDFPACIRLQSPSPAQRKRVCLSSTKSHLGEFSTSAIVSVIKGYGHGVTHILSSTEDTEANRSL